MNRIASMLETYTPRSQLHIPIDKARYRPFRAPELPVKVAGSAAIQMTQPEIRVTLITVDTTVDGGSEPPSSTDRADSGGGSAPPKGPSTFEYLGVAALTALSGIALATLASYIPELFRQPDAIPQTHLSFFDQRVLTHSPECTIFHESSAIQKAINFFSDSLNVVKTSSWSNAIPSSLGITDPDVMRISHRDNPDVALTCSRLSSSETSCSLDSPLAHEKGSMTMNIKESVEPFFSSIHESMTFPKNYWSSDTIEKSYQINSNDQLPDLFTQVLSPSHLNSWKGNNGYTIPTQFEEHLPIN